MKLLLCATLLTLLAFPLLAQPAQGDTSRVPIDSFRGFEWGATEEKIRAKHKPASIIDLHQSSEIFHLHVTNEVMFGLEGDMWYELRNGGLGVGIWEFPARSRRLNWVGRHVARRDVVTVLSLLQAKYGLPAAYSVNGVAARYTLAERVYEDFGAGLYPVNHVVLWWVDTYQNAIQIHLNAESERMVVRYMSAASMNETMKQEDH